MAMFTRTLPVLLVKQTNQRLKKKNLAASVMFDYLSVYAVRCRRRCWPVKHTDAIIFSQSVSKSS